ncbi:MAG: cupin domain-containing protein [Solirubrobacteraceae bacterium]|nr:cupin domain-containing protein [Solirubrobacteraceae bacterium]
MSSSYAKVNFAELDDSAAKNGLESQEARFARTALGAKGIGIAKYEVHAGKTIEFGHRHKTMEELYLCTGGSGQLKIDEDIVDLAPGDVVRVAPEAWRGWRAGDDGLELIAFGTHVEGDGESEMEMGWWAD